MLTLNNTKKIIWSFLFLAIGITLTYSIYSGSNSQNQDTRSRASSEPAVSTPADLYISNISRDGADLWWISKTLKGQSTKSTGSLLLTQINNAELLNNYDLQNDQIKEIGDLTPKSLHYIELKGIVPNEEYAYFVRNGGTNSIFKETDPASLLFGFSVSNYAVSFIESQQKLYNPGLPLMLKLPSAPKNNCKECGREITGEIKDPDGNFANNYLVNFNIVIDNNITSWISARTNENGKWEVDLAKAVIINENCGTNDECTSYYPEIPPEFKISSVTVVSNEGNSVNYENLNVDKDGKVDPIQFEPTNICGNKIIEGIEQCDDGNKVDTDSCSNTCESTFVLSAQDSKVLIDTQIKIPNLNTKVNYLLKDEKGKAVAKGSVDFVYKTNKVVIELDKDNIPDGTYTLTLKPTNYTAVETKVEISSEAIIRVDLAKVFLPGDYYTDDNLNIVNDNDIELANSYLKESEKNKDKDLNGDNSFDSKDIDLAKTSLENSN
ncbi:DUF4215 domain-containing protein [Candidatus Dojkabacteria bacterium]|uniref:DUF4215 domain-containing protein n=1 Tax=Candidatus Dojkabacteria bacterium TaxID=2099670 RepID=A0A955L2V2_9BACT|nr:DUF4215 domain-containing protein [Candidatus Dojkabacteria bacterium]